MNVAHRLAHFFSKRPTCPAELRPLVSCVKCYLLMYTVDNVAAFCITRVHMPILLMIAYNNMQSSQIHCCIWC